MNTNKASTIQGTAKLYWQFWSLCPFFMKESAFSRSLNTCTPWHLALGQINMVLKMECYSKQQIEPTAILKETVYKERGLKEEKLLTQQMLYQAKACYPSYPSKLQPSVFCNFMHVFTFLESHQIPTPQQA